MGQALGKCLLEGVRTVICGDLFLEDIRRYREEKLALVGGQLARIQGIVDNWPVAVDGAPAVEIALKSHCVQRADRDRIGSGASFDRCFSLGLLDPRSPPSKPSSIPPRRR